MELSDFLAALRRRRLVMAIIFIVVIVIAAAIVLLPSKSYSATETLLIEPQAGASSSGGVQVVQFLISATPSQVESQRFHSAVQRTLQDPVVARADVTLSASSDQTTGLLTVKVKSPERGAVEPWSAAVVDLLPKTGTAAVPGIATIIPLNTARQVKGSVPTKAILGGAVVLGLLLAVIGALIADSLRSRPTRREGLQQRYGVPVFPPVPLLRSPSGEVVPERIFRRGSVRSESFVEAIESVRLALLASSDERPTSLAVVSRRRGEGKSLVAASLAWALGRAASPTVALDANLRDPRLPELLGVSGELRTTLSRYRAGQMLLPTRLESLSVIGAGRADRHPAEIISRHLQPVFARVRADRREAVVDTPAFDEAAETAAIVAAVDAVLVVVDERQTRLNEVSPLLADLRAVGAEVLGVVVNRSRGRYPWTSMVSGLLPRPPAADLTVPSRRRSKTVVAVPGEDRPEQLTPRAAPRR